jgi:hypothetical protein
MRVGNIARSHFSETDVENEQRRNNRRCYDHDVLYCGGVCVTPSTQFFSFSRSTFCGLTNKYGFGGWPSRTKRSLHILRLNLLVTHMVNLQVELFS